MSDRASGPDDRSQDDVGPIKHKANALTAGLFLSFILLIVAAGACYGGVLLLSRIRILISAGCVHRGGILPCSSLWQKVVDAAIQASKNAQNYLLTCKNLPVLKLIGKATRAARTDHRNGHCIHPADLPG